MKRCLLSDRGVIAVSGDEAETFLNRLFTNSVLAMEPGAARFAALLSPQGKLLFDFFVVRQADGFLIDCRREHVADLAKKLTLFRLRAKVTIADRSGDLAVAALWNGAPAQPVGLTFPDPRHGGLGVRIIAAPEVLHDFTEAGAIAAYEERRIACGVPEGGVDFIYGDTFVHDANMDLLHGVDFDKGCYVGQEVVSRVHHRNSARKRVAHLRFYGAAPVRGAVVRAGDTTLGGVTSLAGAEGLATLRIDRLAEAESASIPITAEGTLVGVTLPRAGTVDTPVPTEDLYD